MNVKHFTLVYLLSYFEREKKTRVLYGLKKSKFCAGTWVGVGGKVRQGETLLAGALREIREEVPGIEVDPESLKMRALLEIAQGDELRFVHTMVGCVRSHLIPWGSKEFYRFGWWDIGLLPMPLPADSCHWLPRALDLITPPISVKIAGSDIAMMLAAYLADDRYVYQQF